MSEMKSGHAGTLPDGRTFIVVHRWPEDRGPGYTEVRFANKETHTFCWDYENPVVRTDDET
jgi:hypothetical protein